MTNNIFINYANTNGLIPLVWFNIDYPAYAIKVRYKYPTSNPTDFRDRALLQLIDVGVPYSTACSLLMVNDPHQAILQRFKSDDPGPQLVYFDKMLNRLALTPIGKQWVERIELARDGMSCCFIDGYTGRPFPIDVINNVKNRIICRDINDNNPGGIYPFEADIDRRISELNAKICESKERNYQSRLGIPEKSKETSISSFGPKWMKNLSIGVFLKDTEVIRKVFCDNQPIAISPFGWLEDLQSFKLTQCANRKLLAYIKKEPSNPALFTQVSSKDMLQMIYPYIKKEYNLDMNQICFEMNPETAQCHLFINNIKNSTRRSRLLSLIENGIMTVPLPGLTGSICIEVKASDNLVSLGQLRKKINETNRDWKEIFATTTEKPCPKSWRQTLIAIDRHDLLFRYDVEQFIKYGK